VDLVIVIHLEQEDDGRVSKSKMEARRTAPIIFGQESQKEKRKLFGLFFIPLGYWTFYY
jgi:hypothetical protein